MRKDLFGGFPGGRFIGEGELKSVARVIRARSPYRFYGLDLKRRTEELESICSRIFKRRYALAVSSGTAALHTALFSAGVSRGDEVVIPAYGWIADLMSVLALGGVPVIVPVDQGLGLDASFLKKSITRKTKAIIAVHMRGYPCDLKNILKIGRAHRVKVIEDGAQCIGGKVDGNPIGNQGDISILSFQYNKLITGGEGGLLLTNDKGLFGRAYRFHDLGMHRRPNKANPEGSGAIGSFGLNYRLSELQAAMLLPQLKKMKRILGSLKKSYRLAIDELGPVCRRYNLIERRGPLGSLPNHAFLCLRAETKKDAEGAQKALKRLKVPIQRCSRMDGHHFRLWQDYMKKDKRNFRSIDDRRSTSVLDRSLFVEIKALAQGKR